MKKTRKNGIRSLAILLVLVLTLGFSPVTNVEAKAAPRLNYRKVTLVQGKKKKLKVRNLRRGRKVKWYSTKKSVATVNKKGVVKAKKKGKATIVAKVGKRKYRCKVTVKKKVSKKKKKTKKSNKKTKINKSTKKQLPYNARDFAFFPEKSYAVGTSLDFFTTLVDSYGRDKSNTSDSVRTKCWRWYSSNKSVISFNSRGIASFRKVGTARVYAKVLTKSGKWSKTREVTIKVMNGGNIKFSYILGLEDSPFNKSDRYVWDFQHEDPVNPNPNEPKFNVITLKIQNSSSKNVRLDTVAISANTVPNNIYFETTNQKSVTIHANSSVTLKYYTNYAYGSFDQEICNNYIIDKKVYTNIFINYVYNGHRMKAECMKNSSTWKYSKSNYLTRKEFADDDWLN